MSWSLNIGTIAGTAVRLHITFVLFLGWIFVASWISGGPEAAWSGLVFLVLVGVLLFLLASNNPREAALGAGVVALGLPVYLLGFRKGNRQQAAGNGTDG